jgi:hypothetical protein
VLFCTFSQAQLRKANYQYDVKFICGKSDGSIIGRGIYHTAINIVNPNFSEVQVVYRISVALPGKSGMLTNFFSFSLDSLNSYEIDCPEIMSNTKSNSDFRKGFVAFFSDKELDIVAVYTATGRDKQVESIHTERVPVRIIGKKD